MSDRDEPRDEATAKPNEPDSEHGSPREARDELFEAIDHFKSAANLFFERATNDPAVKQATSEAERVFTKLGERAEPLARQLTGELGRLTRRIQDTVQENVEGRRRPPKTPESDDDGEPRE